jgi:hypothetical protein
MMKTMFGFCCCCCAAAGKIIAPVAMNEASSAICKFLVLLMSELLFVVESQIAARQGAGILLRVRRNSGAKTKLRRYKSQEAQYWRSSKRPKSSRCRVQYYFAGRRTVITNL